MSHSPDCVVASLAAIDAIDVLPNATWSRPFSWSFKFFLLSVDKVVGDLSAAVWVYDHIRYSLMVNVKKIFSKVEQIHVFVLF